MSSDTSYSLRIERTSYKDRDLIYEEQARKLVVYLEISGVCQFDLVGCDNQFQKWTEPLGEMIPTEKQTEILNRLAEWSREKGLRINIGPGKSMDEYFAEEEKAGHKVERRADGTVIVYPLRRSVWERLIGITKGLLGK